MPLSTRLDQPAYTTRIKVPGYTGRWRRTGVTVMECVTSSDAAKVLKRANPSWSRGQHRELAHEHLARAVELEREWGRVADEAAQAAFGRRYRLEDYKVSGIASEDFQDEHKDRLRHLAHEKAAHMACGFAHGRAARLSFRQIRQWLIDLRDIGPDEALVADTSGSLQEPSPSP